METLLAPTDSNYLKHNENFDYQSHIIRQHLQSIGLTGLSDTEKAIKLYTHVRDGWHYNPNVFSFDETNWKASVILGHKSGHCIDKAVLLITMLRANNIAARLGLAKVKNHIAVEHVVAKFGSEELVPHGYVDILLNNKWVKATPAFNAALCHKLGVDVLEFDGQNDSLFQEYDTRGTQQFMEYIEDYGTFAKVPLKFMMELMQAHYPAIRAKIIWGETLNLNAL